MTIVFDLTYLEDLFQADWDKAREILEHACNQCCTSLSNLQSAYSRQDAEEIQNLAHEISGGCGSVGATALSKLARALEESVAQNGQVLKEHAKLIESMIAASLEFKAAVDEYLKKAA